MRDITSHQETLPALYEVYSLPRPIIIDFHNILRIELYSEYCRITDLKNNVIQLSHEWAKQDTIFSSLLSRNDNVIDSAEFNQLISSAQQKYIPIFYGKSDDSYY